MKKILIVAVCVLGTLAAKAQTDPGTFTLKPMVGLNMAKMSNMEDYSMKAGAVAGVEAEYRVNNLLGVSAGLLYSMQGAKWSEDDWSDKYLLEYINIPILANFYVWKGLSVKAGLQPGFLVKAKNKYDFGSGDKETVDVKESFNKFDLSIPIGVSYEYNSFVLDLRYNIGVTDMWDFDDDYDGDNSKNGVLSITLGYKFAL